MKILIAPDSFKDALPALQVCEAIQQGGLRALPEAQFQVFPLSDGGEGTAQVLAWHLVGELVQVEVKDPLFRPVMAHFFFFQKPDGRKLAFVEMAQASGLQLLASEERNPLKTSTFGTGQLILEALRRGATELYLAIGGSATNDGGMGMATALGWQFLDKNGKELLPIGENLIEVDRIVSPSPGYDECAVNFSVLCDVTNPLFGPAGAAYVFAQQKGASLDDIEKLDAGLRQLSNVVSQAFEADFSQKYGAGAAGGLGFGAMAFLKAKVRPGAETIMELLDFESAMKDCDLVITGEGKLDGQTLHGKLVAAIGQKAKAFGIPVLALCGVLEANHAEVESLGLANAIQLKIQGEPLANSLSETAIRLSTVTYNYLAGRQFRK
ncbi:MAG: glycerate kinase [Bacteroidetes bacterium]|nr:glycerate kinase [Bacteroidota bacterium]